MEFITGIIVGINVLVIILISSILCFILMAVTAVITALFTKISIFCFDSFEKINGKYEPKVNISSFRVKNGELFPVEKNTYENK